MRKFLLSTARRVAAGVAILTGLGLCATTGIAMAAACPVQASATPFAKWGDTSSYFLAPGGAFEGSASTLGWSLDNASLTIGNEPFRVHAAGDLQSLTIGAGGSATSPSMCLDRTMPYFQFFVRQVTPGSDLRVELVIADGYAHWPPTTVTALANGSAPVWRPVGRVFLVSGMLPPGLSVDAGLRFEVPGGAGSWQIDDVHMDPYRVN